MSFFSLMAYKINRGGKVKRERAIEREKAGGRGGSFFSLFPLAALLPLLSLPTFPLLLLLFSLVLSFFSLYPAAFFCWWLIAMATTAEPPPTMPMAVRPHLSLRLLIFFFFFFGFFFVFFFFFRERCLSRGLLEAFFPRENYSLPLLLSIRSLFIILTPWTSYMCLAWMYSGSCFGFFNTAPEEEGGEGVEVKKVRKKGQRKEKKRRPRRKFFWLRRFQCPIRRLNSPSLLRDALPEASYRCGLREASKRGAAAAGFRAQSPPQREREKRERETSRLFHPSPQRDHRRERKKDSRCHTPSATFRVNATTPVQRRHRLLSPARKERTREEFARRKTEGKRNKKKAERNRPFSSPRQNPSLFSPSSSSKLTCAPPPLARALVRRPRASLLASRRSVDDSIGVGWLFFEEEKKKEKSKKSEN